MMGTRLVITGGKVIDGTGAPVRVADVVIDGAKIEAIVDRWDGDGEIIDASGLTVAPGFIDIHSHSDYTLLVDPRARSSIHQGVTTEVVGNCGFGCFPLRDPNLARTAIYGISDAVPLDWSSPGEYLDRLSAAGPAVNVMSLVPNGQLRLSTMGLADRPARDDELAAMSRLLEEGLEAGAWGYSTGLEYGAEIGAPEEEITALARITAQAGALYATHTRRRDDGAVEAVDEALRTARAANVRLQISHLLPRGGREDGERCLERVDAARAADLDVAFDMHTRRFGLTYLYTMIPPDILARGSAGIEAALKNDNERRRMKRHRSIFSAGGDWERVILLDNEVCPELARLSLAEIGRRQNQDPFDAAYDILGRTIDDPTRVMAIIDCYAEDEQEQVFAHPLSMPGSDATALASDGPLSSASFHGAYSWAAWFYRFMVKERTALTPEEAIQRLTSAPAARLGLADRGLLRAGLCADIAVFDAESFSETATTFAPNQLATGMVHVLVNGVPTLRDGKPTGQHGGAVLRRNATGIRL